MEIACCVCENIFSIRGCDFHTMQKHGTKITCSIDCKMIASAKNCENCNKKTLNLKFCSHSCSATKTNLSRIIDSSSNLKRSQTLKNGYANGLYKPSNQNNSEYRNKYLKSDGEKSRFKYVIKICENCNKNFEASREIKNRSHKNCSLLCQKQSRIKKLMIIRGNTVKSSNHKYYNQTQGFITLQSPWELKVAQYLDQINIAWIRPEPIPWIDSTGTKHLYFSDFFLPEYSLYLDPKNPLCMVQDKEKMEYVEKRVKIVYGNVNMILEYLSQLK